jgi:hypothetical protein
MRIDTESNRWDPLISVELTKKILFLLTWTGAHLSVQLKNLKMEKWEKKQVIPNLYPPAGHPHCRHPAAGHRLQGGRTAPSQARCHLKLVAPRRIELVAGRLGMGQGRRSARDGAGEEICQRWSSGGDPLKMEQEKDSRWPVGVPGGRCTVASPRKKKTTPAFLFFY